MHKVTLSPIPQVDGHSDKHEVTIPFDQTLEELLHLKYAQPPATILHPERILPRHRAGWNLLLQVQ